MSLTYNDIFKAVLLSTSVKSVYNASMNSGGLKILRIYLKAGSSAGSISMYIANAQLPAQAVLIFPLQASKFIIIDTPVRVPAGYTLYAYASTSGMSMSISGLLRIVTE